MLETAGHNERALAAFRRVCELQPSSAVHAYNLGRALSNRGDSAGSLAELERTLAIDPEHRNARATLAEVLRRLGRTDEAVVHLRRLLERNPDDVKAWSALAAFNVVEFDAADIARLERLRARPGLSTDEQVLLAYGLGKAYAAHASYDKAYAAYVQAKRYKEAVPVLEKATTLAPDNADAWATLGWAYFGMKDAAKFKQSAGKARTLGYKEPNLLDYLKKIEGGMTIK